MLKFHKSSRCGVKADLPQIRVGVQFVLVPGTSERWGEFLQATEGDSNAGGENAPLTRVTSEAARTLWKSDHDTSRSC
jgi:hypothetical protein